MADIESEPDNNSNENANGDSIAQKPYVCDICNSRFSVKISLVRHKIIHTDLHICKFCGKHFSSKYDLEIRHMYIHTHEFPFKCDVCGKGFKRRMLLTQHICSGVPSDESSSNSGAMAESVNIKRKSIESNNQAIDIKKSKSDIGSEVLSAPLQNPENNMSIDHHVDPINSLIPVDTANYDTTNGASVKQVSETDLNSLSAANNYYDNQMPSSNLLYEQNVASYEQMLPTTVYDQSTMPASSDIYNLTAVPITNNMYDHTVPVTNHMYTGAQYAAPDPNSYSHIDLDSAEMNNYIPVHQEQSGVIPVEQQTSSTSNQDLINSLNVPTADGSSVVKNELLTMLMSGTSLDNFNTNINSHLYSMPGVSNQGANKGLPTFRDTFAQNSQYVLSPQPAPVMNTFVNPNSGMPIQIQSQLTASSPDLKPETYTSPSTPDSVMTTDDINEEQAGGLVKRRNKNFKCHICKKRYHKQASVDKHMRIHLDPFVCKICDKRFLKEIHLEKHLLAHNAEDNIKNNVSSGLDDILETVSSADFVVENDRFDTGNEDSISDSIEDDSSSILSPSSTVTEENKPLSCSVCKKSYQTKLHLDKHMIIHTNPYVCTICRKKFLRLEFLEKHIAMHRAEEDYRKETENMQKNGVSPQASSYNPISTPQNTTVVSTPQFTSAGLVQLPTPNTTEEYHPEKIRASKPFSCNICKKSYVLESHYAKHMVLHNNPFKCHICSKTFTTKTFLRIHLRKFHDVNLESENLDINLGDYDTDNALLSEINLNEINPTIMEHLSQNQTPFLSPTSTQNTSSLPSTIPVHDVSSLQIQMPMVNNPKKDAQVPAYQTTVEANQPNLIPATTIISTSAQSQPAMERDTAMIMKSENEPKLKPFACTHCNKRYQMQANLAAHMKVHTDPVICKICGKKFASPYLLNKLHMPVHNVDGEAKSVIKIEPTSSTSDSHEGTTSQTSGTPTIPTLVSNDQSLPQPTSNDDVQRLTSTNTMTTNLSSEPQAQFSNEMLANTALQNKPFVCHICNKRYSVKINLTKHMVIHMNPFVCKICGKKFLNKKALEEKHMPVHAAETRNLEKPNILPALAPQPPVHRPAQVQQFAFQPLTAIPPPLAQTFTMNPIQQTHEIPMTTYDIKPQSNTNSIFSCPICHKRFFKKEKLDVHYFNHSKKYSCVICGESFSNRKELEEVHLKKHENQQQVTGSDGAVTVTENNSQGQDKEPQPVNGAEALMMITYDCSTCGKKYNSPKFLKRHLKLHTGAFACKICGKLFSNQYLLDKKHMLTHLDKTSAFNPELGIGLFKCSFCKKTYTFKKNLDKHLDGHKVPSYCKVCPQVCVTKEDLLKHQTDHLENEMMPIENVGQPPPVNATKGPPTLQYFAALAVMMYPRGDEVQLALGEKLAELTLQKLEQDELKSNTGLDEADTSLTEEKDNKSSWLDCPHCDKKYSQKQYLERHITVHTNPYVCKICGKAFSSSYALDVKHMLIHSEERPFKCTVCGMGFKELRRLRDHVKKKHYEQTPHVCGKCGFRFEQERELEEHMKTHVKQNFRCGDCLKLCHSQFTLNEHMKRHTGQKNVHCEQCGNMFVYQSMFDKHLLYTDKENIQYVCPPCSQSFSDRAQFYVIGLMFEGKNSKGNKRVKTDVSESNPAIASAKYSDIQNPDNQVDDVTISESNLYDSQNSGDLPIVTDSTNNIQMASINSSEIMETEASSSLVIESDAEASAVKIESETVVFNESGVPQPENIAELNNSENVNCESINGNISDIQSVQNIYDQSVHNDSVPSNDVQMEFSGNISQSESYENVASEISGKDSVSNSGNNVEKNPDKEITPCVPVLVPEKLNSEFSILKSALTKPQTINPVSEKPVNSNSSSFSDKPNMAKDFKTFTDIMIEKLVCQDDKPSGANKPSILDQLIKSESATNNTKSTS